MTMARSGSAPVCFADQVLVHAENFWQMAENLRDPDDGQVLCIDNGVASGGAHAVAADAEELERWIAPAQSFDKLRAIHLSRSLAGRDQNAQGMILTTPHT